MSLDETAVFAAEHLFDRVVARLTAEGADVEHTFGWRTPAKHKSALCRIAWVPGDAGDAGELRPAMYPGRTPRSVATLAERFSIELSAEDPAHPRDERAQYNACRRLFDAWYRAMHAEGRGTFEVLSLTWTNARTELVRGAEVVVVVAFHAPIFERLETAEVTATPELRTTLRTHLAGTGTP